ncbi:uncharacterized protein SPPG_03211 [Spizellomyces punctatus DAOM BR117]|uniref:Uncharacterized protein n=1 Tax=Spizellomyces punctatus (strain DAOM BR117) TaxID=645134 RepID=A0A0L0HIW3_SPIPD|nr:uncharacterized protein SPPG_03211 [Spizellomyces punctatus DAOM BR117]KND01401.1 hypothetical protein SPPG_03211 [Spizellomyces punctatus DAOM BR117]|eukprot:XP_016609440.1 hypothetical protein SPPG_03211 [Spizellomyces punctatus DAOM BR117]
MRLRIPIPVGFLFLAALYPLAAAQGVLIAAAGYLIPEAAFASFAAQIQQAYQQIATPDAYVTKAVDDVISTAGHGPVDTAAVTYLVQQLNTVIPQDPSYTPLRDATNQLSAAVFAAEHSQPLPIPGSVTTVTFVPRPTGSPIVSTAPSPSSSGIASGTYSPIRGPITSTVSVTTSVTVQPTVAPTAAPSPIGGDGSGTFPPPFQPAGRSDSAAMMNSITDAGWSMMATMLSVFLAAAF